MPSTAKIEPTVFAILRMEPCLSASPTRTQHSRPRREKGLADVRNQCSGSGLRLPGTDRVGRPGRVVEPGPVELARAQRYQAVGDRLHDLRVRAHPGARALRLDLRQVDGVAEVHPE